MDPSQSKRHFHFSALTALLDCLCPLTLMCVCEPQRQEWVCLCCSCVLTLCVCVCVWSQCGAVQKFGSQSNPLFCCRDQPASGLHWSAPLHHRYSQPHCVCVAVCVSHFLHTHTCSCSVPSLFMTLSLSGPLPLHYETCSVLPSACTETVRVHVSRCLHIPVFVCLCLEL